MARFSGGNAVYEIADLFRQRCLLEAKSLLWPERSAWTLSNTTALWAAFMGHPDTGKRTFLEKWHDQLLNESPDAHRVAADLVVLYQLFPTNIGRAAKMRELETIIAWKLSKDPPDLNILKRAFDNGLGSPGIQYLTGKPAQIAFYLQFSIRIARSKIDPHNAQACKDLADLVRAEVPQSGAARHILLHLLFPDKFEWIASEAQRRRIVEVFSADAGAASDQDAALFNIRGALQQRLGREIVDFYDRDIWPLWDERGAKPVRFWIEKTIVRGRPDREKGEYSVGNALWSPKRDKRGGDIYRFMRETRPGDVVFHLTDNEAITAISRVESKYGEFEGVADTEWGLGESFLVPLRDTVILDPPLSRTVFLSPPYSEHLVALIDAGTKNLFYNSGPSLNQGAYLTPAPPELVRILDQAYTDSTGKHLTDVVPEIAKIGELATAGNSWIFQGNPNFYDIRGAIRALKKLNWLVQRFKEEIKGGDRVYLWESGSEGGIVGVAEVAEAPQMRPESENERPFVRKLQKFEGEKLSATLRILSIVDPPISREELLTHQGLVGLSILKQPQGTNFRLTREEASIIEKIIGRTAITAPLGTPSLTDLERATNLSRAELEEIEALIKSKGQIILEGPPGSGKTYIAELFARYLAGELLEGPATESAQTVQFHQSYSYEDFIEGIRPETNAAGQLEYHVRPGVFKNFCDAAARSGKPSVFVIDEINRGNISRILGELLFLLEYRNREILLPYDRKPFSIPRNVYIIGTMNTTDRSLAQIDYALRRRFFFYQLSPVHNGQAPALVRKLENLGVEPRARERLLRLFINLNTKIVENLGEHFQVGHSHFMREDIGEDHVLQQVWDRSIIPLIGEYFYNSRDKASVLAEYTIENLLKDRTESTHNA